jgi:hypothetical protein
MYSRGMTKRTKTEIARLARMARSMPTYHVGTGERQFSCPVHLEALRNARSASLAHKFTVHVLPWENPTTVAAVRKALESHLSDADINDEPCDKL